MTPNELKTQNLAAHTTQPRAHVPTKDSDPDVEVLFSIMLMLVVVCIGATYIYREYFETPQDKKSRIWDQQRRDLEYQCSWPSKAQVDHWVRIEHPGLDWDNHDYER